MFLIGGNWNVDLNLLINIVIILELFLYKEGIGIMESWCRFFIWVYLDYKDIEEIILLVLEKLVYIGRLSIIVIFLEFYGRSYNEKFNFEFGSII